MFQESTGIEETKLMETKCHNQASEEQGRYKAKKEQHEYKMKIFEEFRSLVEGGMDSDEIIGLFPDMKIFAKLK